MEKPIKAVLFRTDGTCAQVSVHDYTDITRLIECDMWTAVYRKFDELVCTIYLDDCGKLRENPVVTAVNCSFTECLVGNLLVCKAGDHGEDEPFTDAEIQKILSCITDLRTWRTDHWDSQTVLMYD